MQQSNHSKNYNPIYFRPESISQYIIKDKNLCLSARGLLLEIINISEESYLSFYDFYKDLHNETLKQELVRAFTSLVHWGYIHCEADIDYKKGPLGSARVAPLRLLLTEHAKRLKWK